MWKSIRILYLLTLNINIHDTQLQVFVASLKAQSVKNLLAMQETQLQFLGQEDPMEKEMATRSSILAWRISWTEKSGRLQSMGSQESNMT